MANADEFITRYENYSRNQEYWNCQQPSQDSMSRSASPGPDIIDMVSNQPTCHFLKPQNPEDITVHMSLPVQDDLETILEECARLRRLGHFRDAIQLFDSELSQFLENRYVLLQYGLCLFEAGEFGQFARLAASTPLRQTISGDVTLEEVAFVLLADDIVYIDDKSFLNLESTARILVASSWPTIDSTEARVLVCPSLIQTFFSAYQVNGGLSNWYGMYRHLVDKGMIWEFRDILQALTQDNSVDMVLSRLCSREGYIVGTAISPDQLRREWDTGLEDESTWFSLLDIFTNMALMYHTYPGSVPMRDEKTAKCMEIASEYSRKLIGQDESTAMSRPYLRWTLAKVLVKQASQDRIKDNILFRGGNRGILKVPRFALPGRWLPIYIPVKDETPEWKPSPAADPSDAAIIWNIIEAAQQLGDLEMHAACLRELLYRGDEPPETTVKKLDSLWRSSGNMHMVRVLQLFRYMLAHTSEARDQLRRDILHDGELWINTVLQTAQKAILAALSTDEGQKKHYRHQARLLNSGAERRMPEYHPTVYPHTMPPPPPPPTSQQQPRKSAPQPRPRPRPPSSTSSCYDNEEEFLSSPRASSPGTLDDISKDDEVKPRIRFADAAGQRDEVKDVKNALVRLDDEQDIERGRSLEIVPSTRNRRERSPTPPSSRRAIEHHSSAEGNSDITSLTVRKPPSMPRSLLEWDPRPADNNERGDEKSGDKREEGGENKKDEEGSRDNHGSLD
ncbi:hypothetical protein QBC38DRAFT_457128 [Podospora fimiseda]|uniref:Uncharacterized protein n=1 Tax=Podospora fimiseda TaxID=252190 RepID=A0AAN7GS02_9PEZI|nr:hypothetical protein QBC38DRAFT_457128 [Podospora fimiseda]